MIRLNKSLQKLPPQNKKNPKRVAAGKATAARTKQAREAQKRALIESQSIIANNQLKQVEPPAGAPPTDETKVESAKNVLTTTQWLSAISIVVSLAGIYYKREEIKSAFTKPPPSPVLPRAPPPSPVAPKKGIMSMD